MGNGALYCAVELTHAAGAAVTHSRADSVRDLGAALHLGAQAHQPGTRAFQKARAAGHKTSTVREKGVALLGAAWPGRRHVGP